MTNAYAITLLTCYPVLKSATKMLDEIIRNNAIKTHNCCSEVCESTFTQVNKIIGYINRKNNLRLLRSVVTKAMNDTAEDYRLLLYLRYIKKQNPQRISEYFNFSQRTFYRKLNCALTSFTAVLNRTNCDDKWFLENYTGERWLIRLYKAKQKR